MSEDPSKLARGDLLGRYVILERIGAGGMGVVYAAYDPELDRKLALKIVRPRRAAHADAQGALLSEARAMARLQHPNVLPVHDTGTSEGEGPPVVFIAMDLIEGQTLGTWLRERRRGRREILAAFAAAGRGLEAAHRAGVVHGDFKPENVLVRAADDQVMVADFGLARADASATGSEPSHVAGTPKYMSPEQHRGDAATARSDQFAFCVALFEALCGPAPFSAPITSGLEPIDALAMEKLAGRVAPFPREARLSRALQRILRRGLSANDEDRYPSMTELLAALAANEPVRARAAVVAVVGLGLACAAAVVIWPARTPCAAAGDPVRAVWNHSVAQAVGTAFAGSKRPYAEATHRSVTQTLDAYAADWTAMRRQTCEATAVRREQSAELLDLRMGCLDRRLHTLGALVAIFREATPEVVDRAVQAARGLDSLDECADADGLRGRTPLPADPSARAQVAAAQMRLQIALAYHLAGKWTEGKPLVAAIVADARALGFPPLLADSLRWLGTFETGLQESRAAQAILVEAMRVAGEVRDDRLFASVIVALAYTVGGQVGSVAEVQILQPVAEAAIRRIGGDPVLERELLRAVSRALWRAGRYAEAFPLAKAAIDVTERWAGESAPELVALLDTLGEIECGLRRHDDAARTFERALAIAGAKLGPDHPRAIAILNAMGTLAYRRGDLDEALRLYRTAHDDFSRTTGPRTIAVANAANNLAMVYAGKKDYAKAATWGEKALSIRLEVLGPEEGDTAVSHHNYGLTLVSLGRDADAREQFERAAAIFDKRFGREDPRLAGPVASLGLLEKRAGHCATARPLLERGVALYERWQPAPPFDLGKTQFELAECLIALGDAASAIASAEAAVVTLEADRDLSIRGDARFILAKAVSASGRDRARIRALVEGAERIWRERKSERAGQAIAWLGRKD